MGVIYEAVQEPLGRRVAVKVIRRKQISPTARERFLREQKVLARLHQSHIVPIFAAGSEGSRQYFAMPYVQGVPLNRLVGAALEQASTPSSSKTPPLSDLAQAELDRRVSARPSAELDKDTSDAVSQADTNRTEERAASVRAESAVRLALSDTYFRSVARVIADAAEAVQHAHDAGILHRDLKPSNLMVDTRGHCWIIDFGLAGFVGGKESTTAPNAERQQFAEPPAMSEVMGTLQYMAPEQYDQRADHRTDVWGLGVTLYELLSLRRAFDGDSRRSLKSSICSRPPTDPRQLVSGVPDDLAKICDKAMKIEPARRYQAADDLSSRASSAYRYEAEFGMFGDITEVEFVGLIAPGVRSDVFPLGPVSWVN